MSNNRIVLVANSGSTSRATYSAATTAGELSILTESTAGVFANINGASATVQLYPKTHILVGKGSGYATDAVVLHGKGIRRWKNTAYSAGYKQHVVVGYDGKNTEQCPATVYNDADEIIKGTLTGKLYEILGLGAPILLISPDGCDVNDVVVGSNAGWRFSGGEIENMATFLLERASNQSRFVPGDSKEHSWTSVGSKVSTLLTYIRDDKHND